MTNLKLYTICLIFCLCAVSCQKETEVPKLDKLPCVGPEDNQDTITGFIVFEKGEQEFGFAKGIKINQPFESSVFITNSWGKDSLFSFVIFGYWPKNKDHSALGEVIGINKIPFRTSPYCMNLTNNVQSLDSILISYNIVNDDVGIIHYVLDNDADNILEIISVDNINKKFKARMKASFIGKKEFPPDLPKNVRFIDTYIEYGYKE